jgi:hypothetical protein
MKKLYFLLFLFISTTLTAQQFDKVKALKTAFITDRLELTPLEAENFWPVYNQYEKDLHELQVTERMKLLGRILENGGVDKLSNEEADRLLTKLLKLQTDIQHIEVEKFKALKKIIPAQKVLKLLKAEEQFKRELFKMLREKRHERRR